MTFNMINAQQILASVVAALFATTVAVSAAVGPATQLI